MIFYLVQNIYIFIVALLLALLEIQIEGKYGWASRLPTWRPSASSLVGRVFGGVMSGKPATGYHLAIFGFVLVIFHWPYFFAWPLTISNWLRTVSLFFMFVVLWDYLWFVCNPAYPLKFFKKGIIKWHRHWFYKVPADYLMGLLASLAVLLPLGFWGYGYEALGWWFINIGLFSLQTIVLILITLFWLKIDKWYH